MVSSKRWKLARPTHVLRCLEMSMADEERQQSAAATPLAAMTQRDDGEAEQAQQVTALQEER